MSYKESPLSKINKIRTDHAWTVSGRYLPIMNRPIYTLIEVSPSTHYILRKFCFAFQETCAKNHSESIKSWLSELVTGQINDHLAECTFTLS